MSAPREKRELQPSDLLESVPQRNLHVEVRPLESGGAMVRVPIRRPGWMVPPLSWAIRFRTHRMIELDSLGTAVLYLCDGRRTVEEVIESFARDHKLSFRESQVAVSTFLRQLLQRGIVVLVGR